jgi:HPt (histidine-containing phosphotransfer) domain-containing protein
MIDSPSGDPEQDAAPADEPVLDLDHLSRATLGNRDLAREVLQLFGHQAATLANRLPGADGSVAFSCAHTLKGSARGIGAWRLARAAERVERSVTAGEQDLTAVLVQLVDAVEEIREAIARHLEAD